MGEGRNQEAGRVAPPGRLDSGCGLHLLDVLADNPWMPSCDMQQGNRGTRWLSPALLPVSGGYER
jgi:hypothetical protein